MKTPIQAAIEHHGPPTDCNVGVVTHGNNCLVTITRIGKPVKMYLTGNRHLLANTLEEVVRQLRLEKEKEAS